ncbi:MAG: carbon monoxide dehydrogenase subunit G [Pseudomonadota bacterium]
MELSDEVRIAGSRDQVYEGLNDPEILKQCIPGCEEIVRNSETELEAKVVLKIGPVKAKFSGTVTLDPAGAPERFSLTGEGNGGIAGFAKGGADVELEEDGDETILRYTAKADVGGKIAQLGSRLVSSTSQKLARAFFDKFAEALAAKI